MILTVKLLLIWSSFLFFTSTITLCLYILTIGKLLAFEREDCHCPQANSPQRTVERIHQDNSSHSLAVLVPFRDRFDELLIFVPHIDRFLKKQRLNFRIFILNQVDTLRFNRASLINSGFKLTRDRHDYIAIHDIDLLPLRDELQYSYPMNGVFHVSSPDLHPKYHYATFLGGILLMKREIYEKVNGMSNRYWGWGLEDDELYTRLKAADVVIGRPTSVPTNNSNTFM